MIDARCGLHCTRCEYKDTCGCGGCIETVSYTHLDVYKRQGYRFLFYCEAEDRWKCLAEHEGEFGARLHHHRFTPVITQKIKLVVTGTVMDETGYDIPHVAYVGAFAAD